MRIQVLPSLLAADYGCLAAEIRRARDAGADALHIDIMDPHFVPNMSFGPDIVALARRVAPHFYRNVHLMLSRPDIYLERFAEAGAQTIQIHVEAECRKADALRKIHSLGLKAAIVVNPETPVTALEPFLGDVDEILVMTVRPGYGGQKFMTDCLEKVKWLRQRLPDIDIMVDGGITAETARISVAAGVNQLVSGSYLFRQNDMAAEISRLKSLTV